MTVTGGARVGNRQWVKIAIFRGKNLARGTAGDSGALWRGSRQSIRGFEGVERYLGDGGLGCGDVQRPEKSPRNVARRGREGGRESGGRRWKKEGWIIGIVGGGCTRGGREERGLDAKRVDSALLDQGPLSLVRREKTRIRGGGGGG